MNRKRPENLRSHRWLGVNDLSAAIFGVPIGLAVMLAASLATRVPMVERQAFFDALHRPNGDDVMEESVP